MLAANIASATQTDCILLKFNQRPSAEVVNMLAQTQPQQDAPAIRAWFNKGETGFVLSATHTNEIAAAVAAGATASTVNSGSSKLHLSNFGKR